MAVVPSRASAECAGFPSDQSKPLLPTSFFKYKDDFVRQPSFFYHGGMSSETIKYVDFFSRSEIPGAYPGLVAGGLLKEENPNIARHNVMAGIYAHDLAYLIGLDHEGIQRVAVAADLHDFGKLHENALLKTAMKARNQRQEIMAALEESKRMDRKILIDLGYPLDVIGLMGANVPKKPSINRARNHTPMTVEKMAETIVSHMTVEQQIIWYVDAMLLDTQPIDIPTRFSLTASDPRRSTDERQIRNQAVREAMTDHYGVDYHELQLHIGSLVEHTLVEKLIEEHPRGEYDFLREVNFPLPYFLQTRLSQRVEDWTRANATPIPSLQAVS